MNKLFVQYFYNDSDPRKDLSDAKIFVMEQELSNLIDPIGRSSRVNDTPELNVYKNGHLVHSYSGIPHL